MMSWMKREKPEKPLFVDNAKDLEALVASLQDCKVLAVDCEMDSFWSYWGWVCLMQLSDGAKEWIVDPTVLDLSSLGTIMADPNVVKIFHDAEYDVRQMRRDFGYSFSSIFDTRAAAALCGVSAPGLGTLLKEHFGVFVDKKYQRADWSKRPLSEEMLSYAQADVAYLHELMELYQNKVLAMGREDMLSSEHTRLESTPASADPYPMDNYYRIKGATKLDGVERRRLREVYGARNTIAAEEDRAPFRLMSNESLIFLSKKPPKNEDEFRRLRGINRHAVSRLVGPVLDALSRASTLDPIERNPSKQKVKLRGVPRDRFERVRKLRARVAREMGVDGSLLLRKEIAVQLAERPPADLEGLSSYLADWQLGLFGVELLETLEG